jgi:hypothetical protein
MRAINKTYEDKLFRKEINEEDSMWWNYYDYSPGWEDYDNYFDYGYNKSADGNLHLLPNLDYIHSKGRKMYHAVDMESFYSKEVMREKRINDLLGLPGGTIRTERPTLGDLIRKDVRNS